MSDPVLYVKKGCPYCAAAMEFLDERKISYRKIDVREDAAAMQKLQELSGQTRTPTMEWDGGVIADFGIPELEKFLAQRKDRQSQDRQ